MDQITLKNFRCFREEQTARLAPLTLLVGENSTGKTSFLAMVRALLDAAGGRVPDFKEEPYDLGSFDEIAHRRSNTSRSPDIFEGGFSTVSRIEQDSSVDELPCQFHITFGKNGTVPIPTRRYMSSGDDWSEERLKEGSPSAITIGTLEGSWKLDLPTELTTQMDLIGEVVRVPFWHLLFAMIENPEIAKQFTSVEGKPRPEQQDMETIIRLVQHAFWLTRPRPFASAPVRSKPRRTYDPSRITADAEGDHVPMYLAHVFSQDADTWAILKKHLEEFGRASGLFDEIAVKRLGKRGGEPFQLAIRKSGRRVKGPYHNLIDMGYGVSQSLPVITELLREDAPSMFLLQQPEVHLHPQAQAELGTLFCSVAGSERQLIIETHSDHLIDRVRMDVRDGTTNLKPEDVSILYFERNDLDVNIYSIRIDEQGNILDAPDTYRRFFMTEVTRSLWKR